jgi:hypothetical protein
LPVQEAHNAIAATCQPKLAHGIARRNVGQPVDTSVHFDHQPMPVANEVHDVPTAGACRRKCRPVARNSFQRRFSAQVGQRRIRLALASER